MSADNKSGGSMLDELDQHFHALAVLILGVMIVVALFLGVKNGWYSWVDAGRVQLHEVSQQLDKQLRDAKDAGVVRIESEAGSVIDPDETTATVTLREGERVITFEAFGLYQTEFPGENTTRSGQSSAFVARCIAQHLVIDLQEKTPAVTVTKDCGHYDNRDTVPPATMLSIAKVAVGVVLNKSMEAVR